MNNSLVFFTIRQTVFHHFYLCVLNSLQKLWSWKNHMNNVKIETASSTFQYYIKGVQRVHSCQILKHELK